MERCVAFQIYFCAEIGSLLFLWQRMRQALLISVWDQREEGGAEN